MSSASFCNQILGYQNIYAKNFHTTSDIAVNITIYDTGAIAIPNYGNRLEHRAVFSTYRRPKIVYIHRMCVDSHIALS